MTEPEPVLAAPGRHLAGERSDHLDGLRDFGEVTATSDGLLLTTRTGQRLMIMTETRYRSLVSGTAGCHPKPAHPLSAREAEVLQLARQGLTTRQIGVALCIAPNTAAQHLVSVRRKYGVATTQEAAARALRDARDETDRSEQGDDDRT